MPALAAGLNSEPQNIEYRTAEFRRMVSLRSFLLKIDNEFYAGSMAERGLRVKAVRAP